MGKGIVKLGEGNWAVKDGNLLAAKETNGRFKNAEFTVSRGTRATYVGRDGLIKDSNLQDSNLITNGGFDTDSDWTKLNATISGGKGNLNADGVTSMLYQDILTNGKSYKATFTVSDYNSVGSAKIINSNGYAYYTITENGTFTIYFKHIFSDGLFYFRGLSGAVFSIDNVSVQEIKTDTPRIDFTDNTNGHLLLEPQSTNLITYSEDFSEWALVNGTILSNTTTSPSGEINADKFTFISGYAQLRYTLTVASSTQYSASFYVKNLDATNVEYRVYDVTNGTDILSSSYYSEISNTEWTRVYFQFNTSATTSSIYFYPISGSYSGSLYIWGAQLEALPYATSYIPTNGSTVTRDAETCTGAGEAADFNSEEGVLYAEIVPNIPYTSSRQITINDGTYENRVIIEVREGGTKIRFYVFQSNSNVFEQDLVISDLSAYYKCAISYKEDDVKAYVNGVEVATSTSVAMPTGLNDISFAGRSSGSLHFYGKVKALRVYKETDGIDLATLTS